MVEKLIQEPAYRIIGVEASPYSIKVRSVMRYRHIRHEWVCRIPQLLPETAAVRPPIMPVVQFPDGTYHTDSTPIILDLERTLPGQRSVIPAHPGHAFLCALIEDMADEWLTKCLFHYRFTNAEDAAYAAVWVVDDARARVERESMGAAVVEFKQRQIERLPLVGCTPENTGIIENSYRRVLDAMESLAANGQYLFGTRPSLADFGLYAQLKTLGTDPTPMAIMRRTAPRTESWVRRLDDASGVHGEWLLPGQPLPGAVGSLLNLAGACYLPFLRANEEAIERGEPVIAVALDGHIYRQPVFRYQAKCWRLVRDAFNALDDAARGTIRPLLEQSGCWALLTR